MLHREECSPVRDPKDQGTITHTILLILSQMILSTSGETSTQMWQNATTGKTGAITETILLK